MSATSYSLTDYLRSSLTIVVFFMALLIATPFILLILTLSLGRASNFVIETLAPLLVRPALWISGVRYEVQLHGDQIQSPAVFIFNHSSTLDILTLLSLGLPRLRFVAKWEFQYNPVFLLLGRLTGQIFIKRQKSEKAIQTLQKTYARVHRQELSIMMAPEGSRKHAGLIGPFKKGPFRIAIDLGYPIVPIYFEGVQKLSKGGSLITRPGKVTAHIHRPVDVSDWTLDHLDEHIAGVRRKYLEWAEAEFPTRSS